MIGGRRDSTHKEIRDELRALGASVEDDGDVGGDHMDFRVGVMEVFTFQVEAKSDDGELTDAQEKFVKRWRGNPVIVLRSRDQAREWYLGVRAALGPLVQQLRNVVGGPYAVRS